ncbi:EpsG family protein [Lactiplantibacillus pentosus]|uniref:EpsG family protein n=1 Tax=Lactiplantibacillus pentosus TaxID=1589 RepID=UPI00132FAB3D|nr:EpsG family protein [Lactiplantibacillus pentosus]MBQ0837636.1 EpsG family protein [Lactiplantibacillus pentosus]MBU7494731.1 EpsG family protein [Lactiplantibacillus pentosus]MBU7520761.1 EpsG family protein [Lactiplantibacillus pentosus]
MLIYLLMFIAAEIFAFSAEHKKYHSALANLSGDVDLPASQRQASMLLWLSAVPFLLIAALRYRVGTDYTTYVEIQIPQLLRGVDYRLKYEYLYQALIKFGMAVGGYQVVFFLTHLVLLFFVWKSFKNLSTDYFISIFIFMFGCYFNLSLNIMRQFIAMAVFLFAIKYIVQKQPIRYFGTMIVGFLFHKTAAIFLPLYLLGKIKIKERVSLILVLVIGVFSSQIRQLLVWITNVTGIYASYFDSRYDVSDQQWNLILFNLAILIVYSYMHRFLIGKTPKYVYDRTIITPENEEIFNNVLYNLQVVAALAAVLSSVIPNSTRIIFMFSIGQILYIPYLLQRVKDVKTRNWISFGLMLMYIIIFARLIWMNNLGATLPYHFI